MTIYPWILPPRLAALGQTWAPCRPGMPECWNYSLCGLTPRIKKFASLSLGRLRVRRQKVGSEEELIQDWAFYPELSVVGGGPWESEICPGKVSTVHDVGCPFGALIPSLSLSWFPGEAFAARVGMNVYTWDLLQPNLLNPIRFSCERLCEMGFS